MPWRYSASRLTAHRCRRGSFLALWPKHGGVADMRPAPFSYHRASTVDEAAALLNQLGTDARILSGGQTLIPAMMLRLARPSALVDIGPLRSLVGWHTEGSILRIGARTTHAEIERSQELRRQIPLLPEVARHIAHPSVRSRGTVGGSLANADPAAEWPVVFLACNGSVSTASVRGTRRISAETFFEGMFSTQL